MLILKNITKNYKVGDGEVLALRGVDITFRDSEFVCVLGPSGCGKTTLLNLIGGLDQYTGGDLFINGRSTRAYRDRDWDAYRNHSVGFVFQTYNLISHQSVLSNVELALTLSGVPKAERRRRAREALEQVGLGDQLFKRPNQLSGGQMQRVAIARALVNDPDILLADEPTGALDTQTSIAVMDVLREVARDRLVIMVTHNPDLAERYATRVVRLLDGEVTSDSDPCDASGDTGGRAAAPHLRSMSYKTALSLSFTNLLTKKARTILTAFAGSIGIIGIALILSLSSGFQNYISRVEEDTLSSYPIQITSESLDVTSVMQTLMGAMHPEDKPREEGYIYSRNIMTNMMSTMISEVQRNDLSHFREYIEDGEHEIKSLSNDIKYSYDAEINIYMPGEEGALQINPGTLSGMLRGSAANSPLLRMSSGDVWQELLSNQELLDLQFELLAGHWPVEYNEVVLIVDAQSEINDMTLYTLGLLDRAELSEMSRALSAGEEYEVGERKISYDEAFALDYRLVLSTDYYEYDEDAGIWTDKSDDAEYLKELVENAPEIRVVGIIKPFEETAATALSGAVGYRRELVEHIMDEISSSAVLKAQESDPQTDIFTGLPFGSGEETEEKEFDLSSLSAEQRAYFEAMSEEQRAAAIAEYTKPSASAATYEGNLAALGVADPQTPSGISIYPIDFESKEKIIDIINSYNSEMTAAGQDEYFISYTDYVGLMMSSVSSIINTISYVLIAFVAISLVVSSIMIGIITYISVLERTKEIGILRSIGASKRDISRVFNAETMIIGFVSGMMGILVTVLLCIPVNIIIKELADISNVAELPAAGGSALVAISIALTYVAGLIPARIAAGKDPVEALRTE